MLLCNDLSFKFFLSLVNPLQLCKLFLSELFFLVQFEKIVHKRVFSFLETHFGGDCGFSFDYCTDLHLSWELLYLCILGGDVFLIDIPLKFEQDQFVLNVFCGLIGNEVIGWYLFDLVLFALREDLFADGLQLCLIGC